MPIMKMQPDFDPKRQITDKTDSYIDEVHLTGAQVLLGLYLRPEKTKGGIILTDKYRDEDIYQGKAALILKMGPLPIDEEDKKFFGDKEPKIGDWVLFRPSDGFPVTLENDQNCRILDDRRRIKAIIPSPDMVF